MVEPWPCLMLTEQPGIIQPMITVSCGAMRKRDIRDDVGTGSRCTLLLD
jgi:hypothetical protein